MAPVCGTLLVLLMVGLSSASTGLAHFTMMNLTVLAETITMNGMFRNCTPTTSTTKLTVQLQCHWMKSYGGSCSEAKPIQSKLQPYCRQTPHTWMCQNLKPFSQYWVQLSVITKAKDNQFSMHSIRPVLVYKNVVNTQQGVPVVPRFLNLDVGKVVWVANNQCNGPILEYKLTVHGWRSYDTSFHFKNVSMFNASEPLQATYKTECATSYNITLQARNQAGWGHQETHVKSTKAADIPNFSQPSSVTVLTPSTAVIHIRALLYPCTVVNFYQVIVTIRTSLSPSELTMVCNNQLLQNFSLDHPYHDYISLQIPAANISDTVAVIIGDGHTVDNIWNRPLEADRTYTALMRVVSKWDEKTRMTCVKYDTFYTSSGRVAKTISALLVIALIILGLIILLYRTRWQQSRLDPSPHVRTPLVREAAAMNTELKMSDLLDFLRKMKPLDEDDEEDSNEDELAREFRSLSNYPLHSCTVAKEPHNSCKNRFPTIIPFDNSRVVLMGRGDDGFINASYVHGYKKQNNYIATQGPLAVTIGDFWHMVWQEKCTTILMLTKINEQGKTKCEQYWPAAGSQTFGKFTVSLLNEWSCHSQEFIVRTLQLQKLGLGWTRQVQQFHFLGWRDHSIPDNPIAIYRLLKAVNKRDQDSGPLIVHCSAGVGRTGTLIAIDYLLQASEAEGRVDVRRCVEQLRRQRVGMVQKLEQYRFIYQVLLEVHLLGDPSIPVEKFEQCLNRLLGKTETYGGSYRRSLR
ncbi:receptor-type tyrosine-protein phosphatase kappa-like [Narcine bancroftii]|uniref:receptor-type tyrosine-protein phosphatase kappa-like n=1 Tax=Narcine bancroftii TaxID=1343680 RepID=UPI003831E766